MINYLAIPNFIVASIVFWVGIYHLLLFFRQPGSRQDLFFFIFCFSAGIYAIASAFFYSAATPIDGGTWQVIRLITLGFLGTSGMWFAIYYTQRKVILPARVITGLFILFIFIGFLNIDGIRWLTDNPQPLTVTPFWNRTYTFQKMETGWLAVLMYLNTLAAFSYILDCGARLIRKKQPRKGMPLVLAALLYYFAIINDFAVLNGVINSIFISEYAFLVFTVFMAYSLSNDIVSAYRIERKLIESEVKYRELIDQTHNYVAQLDRDFKVVFANPSLLNFLGIDEETIRGRSARDFIFHEDMEYTLNKLAALFDGKKHSAYLENRITGKSNEIRSVQWTVSFQLNDNNEIIFINLIGRDITERKQFEEKLAESERKFRSIFESSPVGVHLYQLDDQDRIIFRGSNPAAQKNMGFDMTPLIGKPLEEIYPHLLDEKLIRQYREVCTKGIPLKLTMPAYLQGELRGTYELVAFQIGPRMMAWILSDITERSKNEQEKAIRIRRAQDFQSALIQLTTHPQVVDGRFEEAAPFITQLACQAMQADRCALWAIAPDGNTVNCVDRFTSVSDTHDRDRSFEISDYPHYFSALSNEKVLAIENIMIDPRVGDWREKYFLPEGIQSILESAIWLQGQIKGFISFEIKNHTRVWDGDEINFAAAIADHISLLMLNQERRQSAEILRQSEARYRTLFEATTDAVLILRQDRIIDCNQRALELFRCTETSLHGFSPVDFSPDLQPDGRPSEQKAHELINEALNGTPLTFQWRHFRLDRSIFDAEVTLLKFQLSGENLLIASLRDISERLRAEELVLQIAKSISTATGEEFFRTMIAQLCKSLKADYAFIGELAPSSSSEIQTIAVFKNGYFSENFTFVLQGTPCDTVVGKYIQSYPKHVTLLFPEDKGLIANKIEAYVGVPLFDSHLNPLGLIAVMFKQELEEVRITESIMQIFALRVAAELERQQIERARQASEKRFRSLIENSADGVVMLDERGQILYISPSVTQILGYSPSEKDERALDDFLHPDEIQQNNAQFAQIKQQPGIIHRYQLRVRHKNGSYRWIDATLVNRLNDPEIKGIIANFRDVTVSKLNVEQMNRQLQQLNTLRTVDMAITASLDLRVTLSVVLEHVMRQLGIHAADVLLYNPHMQSLEFSAGFGFRARRPQVRYRLGEGPAGMAALERKTVHFNSESDMVLRSPFAEYWQSEGFVDYYATPLISKGQTKGVLEIYHREPLSIDDSWLNFLDTLAGQAAIAIDNSELFENLQRANLELSLAYDNTLEGWVKALDLRDKETEGHTQRVADITLRLAQIIGADEATLVSIQQGALLHDIGKMAIPDSILNKPGPLSPEEWEIMRKHPEYAYELLSPISYLRKAMDIPYCHHERWDGSGYPRGLRGEQIPLAARIFSVVDVWDALLSDRPYRKGWELEKAIEYLRNEAGKQFDPEIVAAFLKMIQEENQNPDG